MKVTPREAGSSEGMTERRRFTVHPVTSRLAIVFTLAIGLTGCAGGPSTSPRLLEGLAASVVTIADAQAPLGSGFALTPALILTNAHVAAAAPLFLLENDGRRVSLEILAEDPALDLALLRPKATVTLRPLALKQGATPVGTPVYAIGNPFGSGIAVTAGIVSAEPRRIGKRRLLQTDAAINPGNSGGPLIDQRGRVLGVVSSRGAVGSGIGFVIPVDDVRGFLAARLPEGDVHGLDPDETLKRAAPEG